MRFSLLGAAQAALLFAIAFGSGCGSVPLKKGATVAASDLVGCYVAPDEFSLELDLRPDQSFELSVLSHVGPIETYRGKWSQMGNRIFLTPTRPIQSVMEIGESLLISRLNNQYTLRFRDVRGNHTSFWDEFHRTSSCTGSGEPDGP